MLEEFLLIGKRQLHASFTRKMTNSIINRARKALNYLNLILIKSHPFEIDEVTDGAESSSLRQPTFLLRDVELDNDITFNSSRNIALFLTSRRRDRWKKAMIKDTFTHPILI